MRHETRVRAGLLCWITFAISLSIKGQTGDWPHAGPLVDRFDLTLSAGQRAEVLGPLFYSEEADTQRTWAVPPLFSDVKDPAADMEEFDLAYPFVTLRRYGTEYRWQVMQLLSFSGGEDPQQNAARRFTIFPIYFHQRSADPAQNYAAVLPFYGHLANRLFQDEMSFVMLPFYLQTRKRDVVTDHYLFPFFHLRHGNGLHGWKLWPLTGHERKDVTRRTNSFGETEIIGGHDRRFVLWPFFLTEQAGIGTDNPQRQQALLPVYSYLRSTNRDSTTVVWPFFTHITEREKKYSEWQAPWPIVDFARGEGKAASRIWPFYSHAQTTNLESGFYLWPVYKYNRLHSGALDRTRTRVLFFLYSDTVQKNTETGAFQQRRDFWPLFTRRRDYNGNTRLQILAPLEPILPYTPAIERNDSPVWSVWRAEKNPRTGATSQSLLWNLYRRDTAPGARKSSLLFGLFQYQSNSEGKRVRLFYVPVIKSKPAAEK